MADQTRADCEERLVDVGTPLIAHAQAPEAMQPGNGPFDHPAGDAQATAMLGVTPCNLGVNSPFAKLRTMRLGVVGAVRLKQFGTLTRVPGFAANRRNRLDQGYQLSDIVGIGARQNHSERNALRIDREVVL